MSRYKKTIQIIILDLIILWLAAPLLLRGSGIHFKRISSDEGLSQSAVFSILQDSKGFLWIGTQDGLNKYDGYNFEVFKPDPDNVASLSHSWINAIFEDRWGIIWVGTNGGGLNKFDPKKKRFSRFRVDSSAPDCINSGFITSICQDKEGNIWVGTAGGGLSKITYAKNPGSPGQEKVRIVTYRCDAGSPESLASDTVNSVLVDRSGVLWVGTNRGLDRLHPAGAPSEPLRGGAAPPPSDPLRVKNSRGREIQNPQYDKKTGTFSHYANDPGNPHSLSSSSVTQVYEDRSGLLWIGTGRGLNLMNRETGDFTRYQHNPGNPRSLSSNRVSAIMEDRSGILWVGTRGGGINQFNKRMETFTPFRHSVEDPHSLSFDYVSFIYEDSSRILWVGTTGKGINKFDRGQKFKLYRSEPKNPNSLSSNYLYALHEDRGGMLWIGTAIDGLNRFDRKSGTYTHFRRIAGDPASLSSDVVRSIFEDSSAALWIGTANGLNKFNRETDTFTHFPAGAVHSIIEDRSGTMWVATRGAGLNKFNRESGVFTPYRREKDNPNSLNDNAALIVYEAPSEPGVLWIGTQNKGLNRFDTGSGIFTHFEANQEDLDSLSGNFVLTIYEDSSGMLWVGTYGGGLNKLLRQQGGRPRFMHYTEKDGLPSNSIYSILEDESGNLWMSTNKGISKFDPRQGTFKNYNAKDGLQGEEFNGGAYHKSRSGEMFFGGPNGFNTFFPADIKDNPHQPPIVITDFKISNKVVEIGAGSFMQKTITYSDQVTLTHIRNALSFEFAALDFTTPENNKYAYKLENFDKEWQQTGAEKRFAYYTNLDPGRYVFRVNGTNNDGVWNETGAAVDIIILPPFWQTWWFKLLLFLVGIGILMFLFKLRVYREQQKARQEQMRLKQEMEKQQLKKELQIKADFTAMLVHDLRSPLTAVMGYADMLDEMSKKGEIERTGRAINLSCDKMLALINDMLDLEKFKAGKMVLNKEEAVLWEKIEETVNLFTPLFIKKGMHIEYSVGRGMKKKKLSIDAEKISQVLQNLLTNALKFVPEKGEITLGVYEVDKEWVEVAIADNGPGIPADKKKFLFDKYAQIENSAVMKGTGLGLAVSKLIVEAHGGIIGYRNGERRRGSLFFFRLPLG
ncbi:MAG: hypothetical protein KAW12_03350 [Candidatus Aminicenantes bacterium]|nr:hypothetical protein [Candidatus Aminicenantes bacterium]